MAEHQRIDAFELWCWWRFLSVCWTGSEIKPVSPTGNHHWIVTVRNDTESEAPILWPPYGESWLIRIHPNARKVWKKEGGMTENEMVGWHHQLNRREFEQSPGVGDGQGRLHAGVHQVAESDTPEQLNWAEKRRENRIMNPSTQPLVKVDHLQQLTQLHISCLVQNAFLLSSCWIPDPWSVWIFLHHYYQLWIPRKDSPALIHPFLSCEWVKVTQLCPTLCNPDYTVHGILQARILEWVAVPFSRESSQPRDWTQVSRIAGRFFTIWATRESFPYRALVEYQKMF